MESTSACAPCHEMSSACFARSCSLGVRDTRPSSLAEQADSDGGSEGAHSARPRDVETATSDRSQHTLALQTAAVVQALSVPSARPRCRTSRTLFSRRASASKLSTHDEHFGWDVVLQPNNGTVYDKADLQCSEGGVETPARDSPYRNVILVRVATTMSPSKFGYMDRT